MAAKYRACKLGRKQPEKVPELPVPVWVVQPFVVASCSSTPSLEPHLEIPNQVHITEREKGTSLPDSAAYFDFRYVFHLLIATRTDPLHRQRIQDIQEEVSQAMTPRVEDFFEHLYFSLTKNSSDYQLRLSIISDTLKLLEGHSLRARMLEAELLQEAQGVGKLLSQTQELTQRLRDMTKSAEELWCFTVEDADIAKLIRQHSERNLQFQRLVVHN